MAIRTCSRAFYLAPDALQFTGPGDRFQKNLAALSLVQQLEAESRLATDEERLVLAHYSAFGESALLNRLFRYDHATARYVLHDGYAAVLSSDDARHLRVAALTAFYTPLPLVAAIWQAVLQLGLGRIERPRILEPAAGVLFGWWLLDEAFTVGTVAGGALIVTAGLLVLFAPDRSPVASPEVAGVPG